MPKITGKIRFIDPIKPASEKFNSESIDFAIESETEVNGNTYTDVLVLQTIGDKIHNLDSIIPGDEVDITYGIRGIVKAKEGKPASDKNPNSLSGFNNLTATSIYKSARQIELDKNKGQSGSNTVSDQAKDKLDEWNKSQSQAKTETTDPPF